MLKEDTALKYVIKQKGIGIADFAERCGISSSYLSLILNGMRKNISEKVASNIGRELEISTKEVFYLINTNCDSYITLRFEIDNKDSDKCNNVLNIILDALEENDQDTIKEYTDKVRTESTVIAINYIKWYEGWQLSLQNRFDNAIEYFRGALLFEPRGDTERRFMAKALGSLGGAYVAKGNYKLAMKFFRKSLLLCDYGKQVGLVYLNMGTLFRRNNQLFHAKNYYLRAIEMGSAFVKIMAVSSLIQIAFDRNELDVAKEYVIKGFWLAKNTEKPLGKDDLFCNIGMYYSIKGQLKKAKFWFNKCILITEQTKNIRTKHYALIEVINLLFYEGNTEQGDLLLKIISSEVSSNNDILILGRLLYAAGKRNIVGQCFEQGKLVLERCYNLLKSIPPSEEIILCCKLLGICFSTLGELYIAEFYLNEALRLNKKVHRSGQ